jgi:hypothetical protein
LGASRARLGDIDRDALLAAFTTVRGARDLTAVG